MKPIHRVGLIIALLSILLLTSIVLNWLLFARARQYYLQLNETRLDPIGLSYFPSVADQQRFTGSGKTLVVFFGDSRIADWPSPNLAQFEFINRGISSQTSAQALQRFDYHVTPLRPQIVILQICINDLKAIPLFPERKEIIIAECKQNIQQIVAQSIEIGAIVILTTVFPIGEVPIERRFVWSADVTEAIDDVNTYIHSLEAKNIVILDAYLILADDGITQDRFAKNLLHLNLDGYEALNHELVNILANLE